MDLFDDIDPSTPVGELFDQPIEFRIIHRLGNQIYLAVEANENLATWRE